VKWTLAHPAVTSAIIGARSMEQLDLLLDGWESWELTQGIHITGQPPGWPWRSGGGRSRQPRRPGGSGWSERT
jgi:hypothetical protein